MVFLIVVQLKILKFNISANLDYVNAPIVIVTGTCSDICQIIPIISSS